MSGSSVLVALNAVSLKRLRLPADDGGNGSGAAADSRTAGSP